MQQLFVYGSLLFPELVKALTGKNFESREAALKNYRRFCVRGADYPAVFPRNGSEVAGRLLLNVDQRSLAILIFYEGDDYECISEKVECGTETFDALVFIWKAGSEDLEGDWNESHFEKKWLDDYVRYIAPETVKAFERSIP